MDGAAIFSLRHPLFRDPPTRQIPNTSASSVAVVVQVQVSNHVTRFTWVCFQIPVSTTGIRYMLTTTNCAFTCNLIISSSSMTKTVMTLLWKLFTWCPCFYHGFLPLDDSSESSSPLFTAGNTSVCVCECVCVCMHLHVDDVTCALSPCVCLMIFMHECVSWVIL